MRRHLSASLVAVVAAWAAPTAALADTATTATRFQQLVRQAASDPAALRELLEVESVDGVPFDVSAALEDATPQQIDDRLALLSGPPDIDPADASARDQAEKILAHPRFRQPRVPRPFRAPLAWIGDRLRPLGRVVADVVSFLARNVPGGTTTLWIMIAAATIVLTSLLTTRHIRGASRRSQQRVRREHGRDEEPHELETAADEAEHQGLWAEAVRLRFRAGLIRLRRQELIPDDDHLTNGQIARRLGLTAFSMLAETFDAIHYGHRPATRTEAERSRSGWTTVYDHLAIG